MKITLTLEVDPSDVDRSNSTGLTAAAYDRLDTAVADAGFAVVDGPDRVDDDD